MSSKPLAAIVLAAGLGKRFRSAMPKVIHPAAGKPLVWHAVNALSGMGPLTRRIVVVGNGAGLVAEALRGLPSVEIITQAEQLGTGHAVSMCEEALSSFDGNVMVLPGDHPLLGAATLSNLAAEHERAGAAVTLLTAEMADPTGYGRVVRDGEAGIRIVEEADAGPAEKAVREVSTGVWCFARAALFEALARVGRDNAQQEYYLPDAAGLIVAGGGMLHTVKAGDETEVHGVNDRIQLAEASAALRRRVLERLMAAGVTIEDPRSTYVDEGVEVGADTVIRPGTFLEGSTRIGKGCLIGPYARIVDSSVADGAEVAFSVVRSAAVGPGASVGPFASIRPGTVLESGSKAGSFVEIKGSVVGKGSKVPHLSYVGDAEIGSGVNVGAGTITCNYDGETKVKSKTVIGDGALIGSDTMLVAPVKVGSQAVTAAGSVVTRDVEAGDVVVGAPARRVRKRKGGSRENAADAGAGGTP